ncbi:MAG: amidohydrolase [Bryobacterales bacterium]|nr:amidohydrolase [Bryobacterales bacterium]
MLPLLLLASWLSAADVIYRNGKVLTMDRTGRVVEAVAVENGRIARTGTNAEIGVDAARVIDLKGRTLLPGFYAAHDHFPSSALTALYQVDLNSPPMGGIRNLAELTEALRRKAQTTPSGEWIIGRGYDDTLLAERRHPTRADLDHVSTQHPVYIVHTSGHLGVANSKALAIAGITRDTPQPKGGRIRIDPKTGEPNGVIEESLGLVSKHLPQVTLEQTMQAMRHDDKAYAAKGVTTTVIAGASRQRMLEFKTAIARGFVRIRINALLSAAAAPPTVEEAKGFQTPNGQLKVTGVKLFQDGSIQGFTGYLAAPYHQQPEGKQDYNGYPLRTRAELINQVKRLHEGGHRIAIHGNGDAAIDDILAAYQEAQRDIPRPDARHRIEHCQTPREDQLDRMRQLGVTPSFFEAHVYYWGDRHRDIFLGPTRAARISPLASALRKGIRFTLHNDTPVTPVDPLLLVWAAVNRGTTSGTVLGPDQRISTLEALRAVTSDAAWQNFQEDERGSIEPGHVADFVILDRNPLAIAPAGIRDIQIVETILGGKSIYRRDGSK